MQSSLRKILIGTIFFVITNIIAIFGYWFAGWDMLEAIYMVIITIYGVGYGEVRPIETDAMKIFTMGVIITGCTSAIYVLGGFVQLIAEGELKRVLGVRRMTMGIEKLTNHVIVCGYGRVGRILARELRESNQEFVVIDTNQERLREAENSGLFVIIGDATEEKILEMAGVTKARVVASVLPDDAANVFITLTVRELNPEVEIIARGESPSTEKSCYVPGRLKWFYRQQLERRKLRD
ncbi:MAG: NAD-binding protein [Planctomycetaceae bacterium]